MSYGSRRCGFEVGPYDGIKPEQAGAGVIHSTRPLWIAGSYGRHRPLYTIALTLSPCVGVPDRGVADAESVPNIHRNAGGGHDIVPQYNRRTFNDFRRKRSGHRPDRGKLQRRHARRAEGAAAGQRAARGGTGAVLRSRRPGRNGRGSTPFCTSNGLPNSDRPKSASVRGISARVARMRRFESRSGARYRGLRPFR